MPRSIEIVAVNYILSMQDVGFSVTVHHVTCVAFKVDEAAGISHLFMYESRLVSIGRKKLRE